MKPPKSYYRLKASQTDLVTVAKFGNTMEAQLARTKLQSRKIKSYVFDENVISMIPVYDIALGGIRLKVKDSDLTKASKILGNKTRGNFWAPRKLFFFTYLFSAYILGILVIPLGFLIYLIGNFVSGSIDKNLLMCFNAILFGIFSFIYSERISRSNSDWIYKWCGSGIDKSALPRAVKFLGVFTFILGVFSILFGEHWLSGPIFLWCLISSVLWKLFFDFISSRYFSNYMKKFFGNLNRTRQ